MRYVTIDDFRKLKTQEDFDHLIDLAIRDKQRGVINDREFKLMCQAGRAALAKS